MTRHAVRIPHSQWASPAEFWRGHVEGAALGTGVTVLFYATQEQGKGPRLHMHPYDEVFVIREGRARFTVGDEVIEAESGDVVMAPAEVPHKFVNAGPGRLSTMDIHLSPRWIQTDLPDPDAA